MKHCRLYTEKLILIFGSKYIFTVVDMLPNFEISLKLAFLSSIENGERGGMTSWHFFSTPSLKHVLQNAISVQKYSEIKLMLHDDIQNKHKQSGVPPGVGVGTTPPKKWWVVWKPHMSCTQDALLYPNCCLKCQLWATTNHIGAYVVLVSCLNQMNKYNKVKWNNLPSVTSKVSRNSSSSLTSASASCGSFQNLIWRRT